MRNDAHWSTAAQAADGSVTRPLRSSVTIANDH
jgi:hypothetical protein